MEIKVYVTFEVPDPDWEDEDAVEVLLDSVDDKFVSLICDDLDGTITDMEIK
jgi:hypothetical protein